MLIPYRIFLSVSLVALLSSCGQATDTLSDPLHSQKADFYVSPLGNDNWSGQLPKPNADGSDGPFATLEATRNAVRMQNTGSDSPRDVMVMLRGGTYTLRETFVLGLEDNPPAGTSVTFRNYPGETPVLSSGVALSQWRKLDAYLPGLSEEATKHAWVSSIPDGIDNFHTLYDGETRLLRARTSGFNPTQWGDHHTLHYPDGVLNASTNHINDVELFLRPTHQWVHNILPLASVDADKRIARTTIPATYPIDNCPYIPTSAWLENTVEALDEPGEWMVNTQSRKVYYWPKDGRPSKDIVIPTLRELVRIEGSIDKDGPTDSPTSRIHLQGFTFTHGARETLAPDDVGLQHDFDMEDKDNALVRLRGTEHCSVTDCTFINSSGGGVRLDFHSQYNRVEGNRFQHLGGTGILLCGYGAGTKDVNKHNEVLNNYISHVGEIYLHGLGIFLWQSGDNRVAHNLIHDLPYTAIVVSGNRGLNTGNMREYARTIRWEELPYPHKQPKPWPDYVPYLHSRNNRIEYNDISAVVQTLGDGNGIYVSGAGPDNYVQRNYIHHMPTPWVMPAAIRTDDLQDDTYIRENIIYRCTYAGVALKHTNHIENNVIADLYEQNPVGTPLWGYISLRRGPSHGSRIQRNIFYQRTGGAPKFYYETPMGGPEHWRVKLEDLEGDQNLFYFERDIEKGRVSLANMHAQGVELNSQLASPIFMDIENEDFRLHPDSPGHKLGMISLDRREMGLQEHYAQKFFGTKRMRTRIHPDGGVLSVEAPYTITLSTDHPNAVIHYTLDGTEPTQASPRYTEAFALPDTPRLPQIVRAKSFAEGYSDIYGASTFYQSPYMLHTDFEDVAPGSLPRGLRVYAQHTSRIEIVQDAVDNQALALRHIESNNTALHHTHLYHQPNIVQGHLALGFDLKLTPTSALQFEMRDWPKEKAYTGGPHFLIQDNVLHWWGKQYTLAQDEWLPVKIDINLDERTWSLHIATHRFEDVPLPETFKRVDWWGLVIPDRSKDHQVFVDNVQLLHSK